MARSAAQQDFIFLLEHDPWWIIFEGGLPEGLDVETLTLLRVNVYAIIQALDATLDDTLPVIGLLAEIDRRLADAGRSAAS
jgi:hypothetical protein